MFSFLNNIPQVTKNILILNVLFFLAKIVFEQQGINLTSVLGAHAIGTPLFQPYQLITHFFMHSDLMHLLLNMWMFVMLGGYLEKLWGAKRFFIFFFIAAIGAYVFENAFSLYHIYELKNTIGNNVSLTSINQIVKNYPSYEVIQQVDIYLAQNHIQNFNSDSILGYLNEVIVPSVGASGGVFGILAAFAILFPNTEFMIYFTFPVKAKYLVGGYFIWELYNSIYVTPGDNVAHLAHVGGAIVGAAIILFWQKTDKKNFW